jgi:hypothetical protein
MLKMLHCYFCTGGGGALERKRSRALGNALHTFAVVGVALFDTL